MESREVKLRKYVISPKLNDIIDSEFNGEISLIKGSKLAQLFNEGIIDMDTKKELGTLRRLHNLNMKGDIKLQLIYKTKKLVVDKVIYDILQTHFEGSIQNIKASTLNQLVKSKKLTLEQKKLLRELKKASKKPNAEDLIDYQYEPVPEPVEEEVDEEEVEEPVDEEVDEPVDEYSPDSPRYDEEGQPLPYDDVDTGKYLDDIQESSYIVPHRKAFVEFINDGFYKHVLKQTQDSDLKNKLKIQI